MTILWFRVVYPNPLSTQAFYRYSHWCRTACFDGGQTCFGVDAPELQSTWVDRIEICRKRFLGIDQWFFRSFHDLRKRSSTIGDWGQLNRMIWLWKHYTGFLLILTTHFQKKFQMSFRMVKLKRSYGRLCSGRMFVQIQQVTQGLRHFGMFLLMI